MSEKKSISYKDAGVDTEKALAMVGDLAELSRRTSGKRQLMQAFGQFASSFDLSGYKEPVILTSCDGVGTKIKLLLEYDLPEVAGVDLVAMSVNDVLTANALPIMFLDYVGIHALDEVLVKRLVAGMADSLAACDCLLAGGETAEMPGMVHEDIVELSGFVVGVAEKPELLNPLDIQPGDEIFGIPSHGFHSNGWSLVRKILDAHPGLIAEEEMPALLAPTRIYYPEVIALREAGIRPHGMAHITGGGIREKFGRILREGLGADLTLPAWDHPVCARVANQISEADAVHAFNMGFGWFIVTPPSDRERLQNALPEAQFLGRITEGSTIDITIAS